MSAGLPVNNLFKSWSWQVKHGKGGPSTSLLISQDDRICFAGGLDEDQANALLRELKNGKSFDDAFASVKALVSLRNESWSAPLANLTRLEGGKLLAGIAVFIREGDNVTRHMLYHADPQQVEDLFKEISAELLPGQTPRREQLTRREALREPILLAVAIMLLATWFAFLPPDDPANPAKYKFLWKVIDFIGPLGLMGFAAVPAGASVAWGLSRLRANKLVVEKTPA